MLRPPSVLLFIAALVVGASFWPASHLGLPFAVMLVWKGAGVALLALWSALAARTRSGWLIVAVLALGAAGDVVIDAFGPIAGALVFLAGHLVAIALYLGNRCKAGARIGVAIALLVPVLAYGIGHDPLVLPYAAGLGGMAGAAWASRFPRNRVALGALLFVASDLLIFARLGPLGVAPWARLLIWPLYFVGQALIAHGVVQTLGRSWRDENLYHRL